MKDRFAVSVAAFYAAFFLVSGISLPFLPVWLAAKGLDAPEIGAVLAAPLVVRLIVVPLSTRLADTFAITRGALVVTAVASVAGFCLVGVGSGFAFILVAISLASVASTPIVPLADAYALRGLAERRRAYGPVRLWGSVSFIVANLGGGLVLDLAGAANLIWALVAAQVAIAGAALWLPAPARTVTMGSRRAVVSLWRAPGYLAVVVASSLIQASHAMLQGFATLQWSGRGLDGALIGGLWGLGVVAEIALFALSGRLVSAAGPMGMIALGALGGMLRWVAMAFDPPTAALPFLQCLHALSFGATHLGTMDVLTRLAPAGQGATAQGDLFAAQGVTFAVAMALSGVFVERWGTAAYAAMAAMSAAGGLVAVSARLCRHDADRA